MKEMKRHYTLETLQQYVDGSLGEGERVAVADHLTACSVCRAAQADLVRIHRSLEHFPLEKSEPSFTPSVLRQLNLAPSRDLIYRLLTHTGTMFAFLLVAAVVTAVFVLTGVIDVSGGEGGGETQGILGPMGDALTGIGSLAAKLTAYVGSQAGVTVLLFGILVVGFLGVADFVFRTRSVRH
jgi:predicted anti-sigma-YlaC factor YlaD